LIYALANCPVFWKPIPFRISDLPFSKSIDTNSVAQQHVVHDVGVRMSFVFEAVAQPHSRIWFLADFPQKALDALSEVDAEFRTICVNGIKSFTPPPPRNSMSVAQFIRMQKIVHLPCPMVRAG